MANTTQALLCCLGCQHCIDSESCNLTECECEGCEGVNERAEDCGECCGGSKKPKVSSERKTQKFPLGTCRYCGGKDDYAYPSAGDGMITCWLCRSERK